MPLLALWGEDGLVGRTYDVLETWREVASDVTGLAVPGGHYLPEEAPEETLKKVADRVAKAKTWPATARALAGRLRRAATFLRKVGIDIEFNKEGRARTRIIRISWTADSEGVAPSRPSGLSAEIARAAPGNGFEETQVRTVSLPTDANGGTSATPTVHGELQNPLPTDGADDADANTRGQSGRWTARI